MSVLGGDSARRFWLVVALLLAAGTSSSTQVPGEPGTPTAQAERALNSGRYEQVEGLLRGVNDPRAVVLRAQAEVQRGRYSQAESILTPAANANPGGDAALELGLLQMYLGRRAQGTRTLDRLLQVSDDATANDLVRLGRASRALGEFQEANGFFRDADRNAPDNLDVNVAWGELFLEKYDRANANRSFQIAVSADPDNVQVRLGLARVAAEENPPVARQMLERILQTNPNYVPAHLLTAEIALGNRRRDEARVSVRRALAVNPQSLEAIALEAGIAALEGRTADFNARVAEALKINPVYGDVYRVAGDQLATNYRFEEAVELTRRALTLDATSSRANSDLGLQLLRVGDEPGARRALETAFKADPYDTVTYNLLQMLDELDKFDTITEGNLILRFHPAETAVMREYAVPLAKEAIETLSRRWDFTPTGPILVEMFPRHDDFAVRTLGLPGMIGALGACFGKVVTLDSPRARPPGEFSWQATLWHEIAHVVTLQMSGNRVPRWLTEGISEWEERRARPDWGREMIVSFAQAMNSDKVLKVRDLNDGFTDPELISLAYFESSLLVEHLAAAYGEASLRTLLRAYGKGLEGDAALKEAFNATADQIQSSFDAKLEKDFGSIRRALKTPEVAQGVPLDELRAAVQANPESFPLIMRYAAELRLAGDRPESLRQLERAATLIPQAVGEMNPHAYIALVATEENNNARAMQAMEAKLKTDVNDIETARKLLTLLTPLNDAARITPVVERIGAIDPFDGAAQAMAGRLAMQRRDAPRAVHAFRAALASAPADRATAHVDLAEALLTTGDRDEARRQVLSALEIAPAYERAQELLLKIVDVG